MQRGITDTKTRLTVPQSTKQILGESHPGSRTVQQAEIEYWLTLTCVGHGSNETDEHDLRKREREKALHDLCRDDDAGFAKLLREVSRG